MNFALAATIILILAGALVMTLNILMFRAAPRILRQFSLVGHKKLILFFNFHLILMVFFFLGYLVVLYATIRKIEIIGGLFVGTIFFFGAIFVLLGIVLQLRMMEAIKESYNKIKNVSSELNVERNQLVEINKRLNIEIKERELMHVALKESEKRLETILNNLQAGVVILDGETHEILYVNILAAKMIGDTREEIIGKTCHKFICPTEQGKCPISDLGQKVDNSERILLCKDGWEIDIQKTVITVMLNNRPHLIESFIDITEKKITEEKIKLSLHEKEILLKEIHHRVKNNLQIINSLLNLQASQIQDDQALALFKNSQQRIRTIALIHEKLYQTENLSNIDFAEYVNSLTTELQRLYDFDQNMIKMKINITDIFLPIDLAIPCGLIINELVSNAFKHAFPPQWKNRGIITVSLHSYDRGSMELIVRDNGKGIPDSIHFRETESLGLKLVTILAEEQLEGAIKLNRTEGTEFQIRF